MQKFKSDTKVRRAKPQPLSPTSLRSNEVRIFDCVYDPSYTVPSEKEFMQARLSAENATIPMHVYPKFDLMFEDIPKSARMDFLPKYQPLLRRGQKRAGSSNSSLDAIHMIAGLGRFEGGGGRNDSAPKDCKLSRHVAITSECKLEPPSLFHYQPNTNVNVINVKLSDSDIETTEKLAQAQCRHFFGDQQKTCKLIKTRGTQTLYRESSAQTLPYLPGVSNDEEQLKNLEIFQLPTILPGDGPPGIYEVEVLERARKRWAFNKALKETFRRQIEASKENLQPKQQTTILEAFEWERWMEREEYIQECQMLRLEMVIRMFEAREKKMHQASKTRIELSMEKIAARREAGLHKNEVEFGRQMRRLDIKKRNQPRCWRKENIASQFGSPSSEFYAPQMRYGVNPSRRHFVADRKAFEERMDDLEKKAVNMRQLVCPFAKLKRWSKPKSRLVEVEQNFCSDNNLKNLYESLKNLRKKSTKQKIVPKCLIEKVASQPTETARTTDSIYEAEVELPETTVEEIDFSRSQAEVAEKEAAEEAFRKEIEDAKIRRTLLMHESHTEELEAMLAEYEGSTIGWMMKFLADESLRLQEQRKLHYLTMLAQRERWRREAAEAGLRQKENDLREIYEKLFHQSNDATIEVCTEYLQNALDVDTKEYADFKAVNNVTQLAKTIDADIKRWLESFKSIQNPLNYETLRHIFKDLVFPNVNVLLQQYETELVVGSMIDDVLFPELDRLLEPIMISNDIAEEMIDRLIDNDLYYFSEDSCSSAGEDCTVQEKEARAIIRKLIRHTVPGRRWMTPAERTTGECVNDILDNVFANAKINENWRKEQEELARVSAKPKKPKVYHSLNELRTEGSHINLNKSNFSTSREKLSTTDSPIRSSEVLIRSQMLGNYRESDETPPEVIIKELSSADSVHQMEVMDDRLWEYFQCPFKKYGFEVPEWYQEYADAHAPPKRKSETSEESQLDLIFGEAPQPKHSTTCSMPDIRSKKSRAFIDSSSIEEEEIDSREEDRMADKRAVEIMVKAIIYEIIKSFIPAEGNEDMEEEEWAIEEEEEQYPEISIGTEEISDDEFEDNPTGALARILAKVMERVSDGGEEIPEEMEEEDLVIEESELELMESNRCKCKKEMKREAYVRKLLLEGKVKVIERRRRETEEDVRQWRQEQLEERFGEEEQRMKEHGAFEIIDSVRTFEYESEVRLSKKTSIADAPQTVIEPLDETETEGVIVIETIDLVEGGEPVQDQGPAAEEIVEVVEAAETVEVVEATETVEAGAAEELVQVIAAEETVEAVAAETIEAVAVEETAVEAVVVAETAEPTIENVPTEIVEPIDVPLEIENIPENIEPTEIAETVQIENAENVETSKIVETIEIVEPAEVVETAAEPTEVTASADVVENIEVVESAAAPLDTQPAAEGNDQETTQNEEVQE